MTKDEEGFWDDLGEADENTVDNAKQIKSLLSEWKTLENEKEVLIEATSDCSKRIAKITGDLVPNLMSEMGTEVWKDPETGVELKLADTVNSALPKDLDKRNMILAALRPLGVDEIMGAEYTANFMPSDTRKEALELLLGVEPQTALLEEDIPTPATLTNSQVAAIMDLRAQLGWDKESLPVSAKLGVHGSRFKSWLLKKIASGHGNEIKEAGIWHGKRATKKEPKK